MKIAQYAEIERKRQLKILEMTNLLLEYLGNNALEEKLIEVQDEVGRLGQMLLDDPLEVDPTPADGYPKGRHKHTPTQPETTEFDPKNYIVVRKKKVIPVCGSHVTEKEAEAVIKGDVVRRTLRQVHHYIDREQTVNELRSVRPVREFSENEKKKLAERWDEIYAWDGQSGTWIAKKQQFDPKARIIASGMSRYNRKKKGFVGILDDAHNVLQRPVPTKTFYGKMPGIRSVIRKWTITGHLERIEPDIDAPPKTLEERKPLRTVEMQGKTIYFYTEEEFMAFITSLPKF